MITEDDLRRTLHSHERLAPDPAPVAARITAGVRTRRRHRYAGTAAAAVAAVVAVAVPTLVLRQAGPARDTGTVAAPTQHPGTPAAPPTVRFTPLTVPFTVGWLPAGWFENGMAYTSAGLARRSYENDQGTGAIFVQMWDTKISGKSSAEMPPVQGGAVVRRQVNRTVWLLVGGPLSNQDLNKMLRSVDLRRPEALTFPFRATWLPAGYRVMGAASGAHHWHGDAAGNTLAAEPPLLDAGLDLDRTVNDIGPALGIGVSTEDGSMQDKGLHPNGTLLGHPSHYGEDVSTATLHVYGVNGMHIAIYATTQDRPELNRATLERIARGLRLVSVPDQPARWTNHPMP